MIWIKKGIEASEFKNYFLSFGLNDDEFTLMVFKNIDVDGDGDLSKDGNFCRIFLRVVICELLNLWCSFIIEFTTFGTQFFLCNDENHVSKYFFGPLVQ